MRDSKGQNVIEYILLVTAVLVVCIYYFTAASGGPLQASINAAIGSMANQVNNLNGGGPNQIQLQ
jgi:Flp pilus assembly pilin Flp